MSCLYVVLLVVVGLSAPTAANAVQVDISYVITGGSNTTGFIGGAAPTGGTATVRWSMVSLYGYPIDGAPGTLLSLTITAATAPVSGGLPQGIAPFMANQFLAVPYGLVDLQSSSHPTFTDVVRFRDGLFVAFFSFAGSTVAGFFQATGSEVSRAEVPEPAAAVLLTLGLCGVAAGRTVWRRRGRRSA
jgi:hypothetical protein